VVVLAGGVRAAGLEGGFSIASAPEVILGEVEYGAPENGARFWRIPLVRRDSLTLDLSNGGLSGRDRAIRYCLLAPVVRDATLGRSECAWQRTLRRGEKYQLRFSATASGSWTLGAVSSTCSTFQACATAASSFPFVYEFTASVRLSTRTTLRGPRVASPRARVTFTGAVNGANGGKVQIQTAPSAQRWRSVATVAIKRNGTFAWSTRAPSNPGDYQVRAVYAGDNGHLSSFAVYLYRVAG
jgi:hypothetical protein